MTDFVLNSISIKNFKKHKDLEVTFSEGITAIKGPNYSGKSTVTQAIFYTMFGATAVPGGKQVIKNLEESGNTQVCLFFTLGEKFGVITRSVNTATAELDGELVATGHTSVNAWMEDVFGLPQKLVLLLSRSSQGETSTLVTLGASELNRIIESVANTKDVDNWAYKADKIASIARGSVEVLGSPEPLELLEPELSSYKDRLSQLDAEVEVTKASLSLRENSKEKDRKLLAEAKEKAAKALECKALRDKSEATIANLTFRKESFRQDLATLTLGEDDKLSVEAELKDIESKISETSEIKGAVLGLKTHLRISENNLVLYSSDLLKSVYVKPYAEACEKLEELKQAGESAQKAKLAKEAEVSSLKGELKSSVCSSCKRPFDEEHAIYTSKRLEKAEESLKALRDNLQTVVTEWVAVKTSVDELKEKQPKQDSQDLHDECVDRIRELKLSLSQYPAESAVSAALDKLNNERAEIKAKLLEIKSQQSKRSRILDQISEIEKDLDRESKRIQEIEVVEVPDFTELEQSYNYAVTQVSELSRSVATLEGEVKVTGQAIKEVTSRIDKSKSKQAEIARLESRAARFSFLCTFLRKNKATFLSDLWDGILSSCSEFCFNCTNGTITEVSRDEDGNFSYVENGLALPVEAASGGQRSIMGVGLRLALASLLPQGCRLVVLDEPTGDLNNEHAAMLTSALAGQGRQVIMVTHREGDEIMADSVVNL